MSVTISRLRHQGRPGLQADQCVRNANTMPKAIEMGTSLSIVSPATLITDSVSASMANTRSQARNDLRYRSTQLKWDKETVCLTQNSRGGVATGSFSLWILPDKKDRVNDLLAMPVSARFRGNDAGA